MCIETIVFPFSQDIDNRVCQMSVMINMMINNMI